MGVLARDERTDQLTPIGAVIGGLRDRFEQLRRRSAEQRQERIADGHKRWGWPLDASCDRCGDTGNLPNSLRLCSCPAAVDLQRHIEAEADLQRRRDAWEHSGVPQRFRGWRIAGCTNERAAAVVSRWIAEQSWSLRGQNLFLYGPVGTGKTGLAIGALWEIHESTGASVAFWSAPDLLDQMRPGSTEPDPMPRVKSVDVLVLDDLGVEKTSDWVRERLYVLIDARYGAQLPTIVTSNRTLPGLAETLGDRIVSRFGELVEPVLVSGVDRRRL